MPGFFVGTVQDRIEEVLSKGKKIYLINSDTTETQLRHAIFQMDTADGATIAAKIMANAIGKKGKILIITGSM